jgi:hypothetical protein
MSKKEQQADGRARTVEIYNAATWADVWASVDRIQFTRTSFNGIYLRIWSD